MLLKTGYHDTGPHCTSFHKIPQILYRRGLAQNLQSNYLPSVSTSRCLSISSNLLHSDGQDKQEGEACGKAAAKASSDKAKTKRGKTPIGKLDELEEGTHPFQEKEPLKPWPGGVNPGYHLQ
jgi:hypothetical protein